jgi:large subunit ribosomal protein L29
MKFQELSQKSVSELQKELAGLREQVGSLKVKNRLGQTKNPHEVRQLRKDIARVLTALKLKS